jgi:hypothetical protein
MSSILDALNKLEQEKAARQAQHGDDTPTLSPEQAAAVLIGKSSTPETIQKKRIWIPIVLALFGGFVLALLPLGYVALSRSGGSEAPTEVASLPPNQAQSYQVPVVLPEEAPAAAAREEKAAVVATPAAQAAPQPQKPTPAPKPAALATPKLTPAPPPALVPEPIPLPDRFPVETPASTPIVEAVELDPPVVEAPAPEPVAAPVVETPVVEIPVVSPEPVPAPVVEVPVEEERVVVAQTPTPYPSSSAVPTPSAPAARKSSGQVHVDGLPRLSSQDRARLGLDGVRLNVLRPADKDQPDALAIINLKKVYVGETIPGTRARLIGVVSSGIGIEIESDGSLKQYRMPR